MKSETLLEEKIKEIAIKWKSEMQKQNITNFKKFHRLNRKKMYEDMEEFWDLYLKIELEGRRYV